MKRIYQLEYNPIDIEPLRTQEYYKSANFDNANSLALFSDDCIKGFLDNEIFINMCDLSVHYDGSHRFYGIFAHSKCNKDIGTFVKVSINNTATSPKKDKVEIDSTEFDDYFSVYSDNKIIATQLLTSDIMELLVDFYKKYFLDYEIVFRNNTIYTRFFTGPMFEPKIFGNSMNKQLLFTYYCILKFITEVSQKVNKVLREMEV